MTQGKPVAISATYRVTTPMFLGGAEPRMAPELRESSIKAMLRYWWRATSWGSFLSCNEYDETKALLSLSDYEDVLFGSTRTGQSRFSLRVKWTESMNGTKNHIRDWPPDSPYGSGYLGYGITKSRDQQHQVGFREDLEFEIQCLFRPTRGDDHDLIERWEQDVTKAIRILGLFGGLGSRSRRGFGSLNLVKLNGQPVKMQSVEELKLEIRQALPDVQRVEFPPFTAFSRHARVVICNSEKRTTARERHEELGNSYRNFRGQSGSLRGVTKVPLGLPLAGVDSQNRRASPLFMSIHSTGATNVAVVGFIPAVFHPSYSKGNAPEFYSVVNEWLNQMEIVV